MRVSPITGSPIAEPEDFATNFPVEVDAPRTDILERVSVPRYANAAARDAAITAPIPGQHCWLIDTTSRYVYDATAGWITDGVSASAGVVGFFNAGNYASGVTYLKGTVSNDYGSITYDPAAGLTAIFREGIWHVTASIEVAAFTAAGQAIAMTVSVDNIDYAMSTLMTYYQTQGYPAWTNVAYTTYLPYASTIGFKIHVFGSAAVTVNAQAFCAFSILSTNY